MRAARDAVGIVTLLSLAGCGASTTPDRAFLDSVDTSVELRAGAGFDAASLLSADVRATQPSPEGVLTREEAMRLALERNTSLIAAAETLTVAQAALAQAGLLQNPTIGQNSGILFPLSPVQGFVSFDFLLSQQINTFLTRDSRVAIGDAQRLQAGIDVASAAFDVAMQARAKHNEVAHLERSGRLAERVAAVYRRAAAAAEARARVGVAPLPEVNRARLQAMDAERQVRRIASQRSRAARELQSLMGRTGDPKWSMPPDVLSAPTERPPPTMDDAEALAVSLRLDVDRADLDRRVAERGVELARIGLFPSLTLGFDGGRGNDKSVTAGPVVQFTLPIFDPGVVALRAAESQERKADKVYVALLQQARQDARSSVAAVEQALDDLKFYRESFVPQQEENVRLAEQSFELGNTDLDSLLNTLRDYVAALQASEDFAGAFEDARTSLCRALGADVDAMPQETLDLARAEARRRLEAPPSVIARTPIVAPQRAASDTAPVGRSDRPAPKTGEERP